MKTRYQQAIMRTGTMQNVQASVHCPAALEPQVVVKRGGAEEMNAKESSTRSHIATKPQWPY